MKETLQVPTQFLGAAKTSIFPLQVLPEVHDAEYHIDLGGIAYDNHHKQVFHAWLNLDRAKRGQSLFDRYIFLSVAHCTDAHLENLLKLDLDKSNLFVEEIVEDILFFAQEKKKPSLEWFRGLDHLASAFTDHNYLPAARQVVAVGLKTGVVNFPRLAQSLNVHASYLDAMVGRREKAAKTALNLVHKPYLLPNRKELPKLYEKLMFVLSASNHLREYREVIWRGTTNVHAEPEVKGLFFNQVERTYRGTWRAVMHNEITLPYRLPYPLGKLDYFISNTPFLAWTRIYYLVRWAHEALLYMMNMGSNQYPVYKDEIRTRRRKRAGKRREKRFLVARAMGGIGDVVMMSPGLKALAKRYPKARVDFAIPKAFHPLFEGFTAVNLLDINEDDIDMTQYKRWINLTDCPAGRVEAAQYPNVKRNRIEIFARAMGISRSRLKRTAGFIPFYQVTPEERDWAREYIRERNPNGLPVVGIQPYAADTYKDWPYMEDLALTLSKDHAVLIFHNEPVERYVSGNIHKVLTSLRNSCALVEQCERMVVVDSSFLHLAAAMDVKTVAVFGPTSAKVFCRYYKNVRTVTPQKPEFPCFPCWRNEEKLCHLTNGRESICLRSIQVQQVIDAMYNNSDSWHTTGNPIKSFRTWMLYGQE